jgi:DNA-binding CsgD family transcriptional regulator
VANDDRIAELIGLIYDAALDPALWPQVVRRTCLALEASCGHFQVFERAAPAKALITAPWSADPSRLEPKLLQSYYDYYIALDLRLHARAEDGRVYTGDELVEPAVLRRSEYLADFLSPLGIYHFCGFATAVRDGTQATFSLHRPRRQHDFSATDKTVLQVLAPHLVRAAEISRQVGQAREEMRMAFSLLDALPLGVTLLDREGRAVFFNRAAGAIFARADGIRLDRRGQLCAANTLANAWLKKAIASCLGTSLEQMRAAGDAAIVPRVPKGRGYAVTVSPAGMLPSPFGETARARAVLLLRDLDRRGEARPEVLRRLYRLTPAEARLAALIADGLSLKEAAEALSVTPASARVTLKRAFQKTGTRRQAELVRLVLGEAGLGFPF